MEKIYRIGHGYDVHRLKSGRALVLGGVTIPHSEGLDGHSDADVLVHALIDSMIGALALGDIGVFFPDTDERYRGISSIELLARTEEIISGEGYRISNADMTIVAQAPKLSLYIPEMRKNISRALGCDTDDISIKATTEEKLGFTGRLEGISAHCVCLLKKI